jgi:hypothetical protein
MIDTIRLRIFYLAVSSRKAEECDILYDVFLFYIVVRRCFSPTAGNIISRGFKVKL